MAQPFGPGMGVHGDYYDPKTKKLEMRDITIDPESAQKFYGDTNVAPNPDDYYKGEVKIPSSSKNFTTLSKNSDIWYDGQFDAGDYARSLGMDKNSARAKARELGYGTLEEMAKNWTGETIARQTSLIGNQSSPIYDELDRQLESLGTRKTEMENKLGGLIGQQIESVRGDEASSLRKLDEAKGSGLRSLSEDLRNSMEAAGRYIGGMGAGWSTAGNLASEAITRQGQKSRSDFLGTMASKMQDVRDLATKSINGINQYKTEKLMEIGNYFQTLYDDLSMKKATAKGDEAKAVREMELALQTDLKNQLMALEKEVTDYALEVDTWAREKAYQLNTGGSQIPADIQLIGNQYYKVDKYGNTTPTGIYKPVEDSEPKIINAGALNDPYLIKDGRSYKIEGYDYRQP